MGLWSNKKWIGLCAGMPKRNRPVLSGMFLFLRRPIYISVSLYLTQFISLISQPVYISVSLYFSQEQPSADRLLPERLPVNTEIIIYLNYSELLFCTNYQKNVANLKHFPDSGFRNLPAWHGTLLLLRRKGPAAAKTGRLYWIHSLQKSFHTDGLKTPLP